MMPSGVDIGQAGCFQTHTGETFSRGEEFQMVVPRTNSRHRLVECDELEATYTRQMQQCGVGYLPVADDSRYQSVERTGGQRWCGFYIVMSGMRDKTMEQM